MILGKESLLELVETWRFMSAKDVSVCSVDLRFQSDKRVWFLPKQSKLVATVADVYMPHDLAGMVTLRTSMFRRGFALASMGWVDANFRGQLTVRLTNTLWRPILLRPNERFIQLVAVKLDKEVAEGYTGKYQDSHGVVEYIPD